MAINNKIVLNSITWNVTGTINIPGTEFEEKDTYTLKITIADDLGNEAEYIYEVTNALGHYPAMAISGEYNDPPAPHSMFYVATVGQACAPDIVLRNITSNITFNLVSSTGDTTIYDATLYGDDIKSITIQKTPGTSPWLNQASTSVNIEADFPLFIGEHDTYSDAYIELDTYEYDPTIQGVYLAEVALAGDYTNVPLAVNSFNVEDTIPKNKIYFIHNRLKKNGTIIETKRNEFQIAPNGRIWLVAPEHSNTGQSYNMTLYMQGTGMTFKHRTPGSPWTVEHLLTPTFSKYYYGEWTDYNNGDFYNAINNTNIPIFADTTAGDAYGDGLIGEDMALNAGELEDRRSTAGTDLESTDIPNITVGASGIGCNVWALDRGNLNSIMSILFDDDQTIIDDIKNGTWLWGNNPVDFIISCYFVPFAISNFYDTTTERVYLGFYDTNLDYTRVKESKSSGQRITLVNTTIDSVYGDWRDYTNFKYEIYLPYVGFYPLDVMSYLNKTLTVEMAFDIMTHNIRYYLFANGKIVDRVDGSVGYDIPLMATDQVNKAKSDLAGITNIVKGGIGMVSGGMTMGQGYSTAGTLPGGGGADDTLIAQGRAGIIGGAMDAVKGIGQMAQYPKQEIVGNISSSMNIYDINYAYLKITEKDTLKPDQLNTLYNYPSYFMGNVSELSGYTEIADIRFSCSGTENEINEIFSLLRNGVIL